MHIRTVGTAAVVMLAMATGALAQTSMSAAPMAMTDEKSYTGCIQPGGMAGSFILAHAVLQPAGGEAMKGKTDMKAGDMSRDTGSAMASTKRDAKGKGDGSLTLSLSSTMIDFRKHVGHKVTVTGTDDAMGSATHAFKVSTLKMIAARCGS